MPRIPRAEVSLETRVADQPFSSGDGYAAPGRAMQQLGQGLASLGAGLDAWNAKEEEQNAFRDDLTLLKAANQADRDLITYRESYRGDGSDYDRGAQEIIHRNLNVGDQMVSKRGRERFALQYERLSGARTEQSMRQGSALREKSLFEGAATAIGGQMSDLIEDKESPDTFTERFERKLSDIEMIIDRMPIGERRTALEKHAAGLAKAALEARGLKELPMATELIKRWSGESASSTDGADITPDLSAYSPQKGGDQMEGGYQSSRPGPDGKSEVRTLADVAAKRSSYVTIAGNPRDYGKTFTIPKISFIDASGKTQTLNDVKAVVHDTGGAFKDAPPSRFDVAIDRDASNEQMAKSHALWKQEGVKFVSRGSAGQQRALIPPSLIGKPAAEVSRHLAANGQGGVVHAVTDQPTREFNASGYGERTTGSITVNGRTYEFVNGGSRRGSIPLGEYTIGRFTSGDERRSEGRSYTKDAFELSDVKDDAPGTHGQDKRRGLLIHDGNSGTTAGCIGIKGDFQQFRSDLAAEMRKTGGPIRLNLMPRPTAESSTASTSTKPSGGILTSLEDAPSADEIDKERPSVVDMDLNKRGANKAVLAAKRVGAKVAAYHEGGGGGASWGEGERDLTKPDVLSKLSKDAKALANKGADYLHVDNMHNLDAAGIGKVAEAVRQATDGKMSIIAKNNPAAWVEAIKANPEIKPPYAIIEHGMKDQATQAAAKQLADMGVPVHFVEFGDPGKDKITGKPRTDPISTAEEARAFAKGNAWANVIHMPTQDRYDGRSVNGAQVFRGEAPQDGNPAQVAQARTMTSDAAPSGAISARRGVRGHLSEMLVKDMGQMAARHQKLQEHIAALEKVDRWMTGKEEFNKYNDANRKLLDKTVGDVGLADDIMKGGAEAVQFGIMASQVTNYVPKPVAEGLLGLVKSTDPLKRVRGYEAAGSILDRNPDAFSVGDDEKKLAQEARDYQAAMKVVDPSLSPADQQKLAVARIDERRSPEWAAKSEARKKIAEANVKSIDASSIGGMFDSSVLGIMPNPGTVEGDVIALKYRDAYKDHFTRVGDDAQAKLLAQEDLKREYGVTKVLGRNEVMKHPPDRRYPSIFNPETKEVDHKYLAKDIEQSVSAYAGEKITIDKIRLRGDEQTDRDIRAGRPPSYAITFMRKDKSGTEHQVDIPAVVSPGGAGMRWSMREKDIDALQVKAAKEFGELRAKESLEKSKSLGQKAKELFAPPPEWKDRPETPEQKALKSFIEKFKGVIPKWKPEGAAP